MGPVPLHADDGPAGERDQARGEASAVSGPVGALWRRTAELLGAASDAREPPLVPPTAIPVNWRARRISSVDLGAPLLAVEAADVDGRAPVELIALTTRELLIVQQRGRRTLIVRARAALPAELAVIRPRDPVGSLIVADIDRDGQIEIVARSSERARGAIYRFTGGELAEVSLDEPAGPDRPGGSGDSGPRDEDPADRENPAGQPAGDPAAGRAALSAMIDAVQTGGYPLCLGKAGQLEPGFNVFSGVIAVPTIRQLVGPDVELAIPPRFYALRCRSDLRDPAGRALRVVGIAATDRTLSLWAHKRCQRRDSSCREQPTATASVPDVGVAFELTDINRDGYPEIAVTAATPPGQPDEIVVLSWKSGRMARVFRRSFSAGVAGLTTGDIDGDGAPELIAAVRARRSTRIDVWTLNR